MPQLQDYERKKPIYEKKDLTVIKFKLRLMQKSNYER
jgi:hypothetical protein